MDVSHHCCDVPGSLLDIHVMERDAAYFFGSKHYGAGEIAGIAHTREEHT